MNDKVMRLALRTSAIAAFNFLVLTGCSSTTSQFDLGGTKVSVPNPNGYVPVSDAAQHFFLMQQSEYPQSIALLQLYLTKNDLRDVLSGMGGSRSSFRVMTERRYVGVPFSQKDFDLKSAETRKVHDGAADRAAALSNKTLKESLAQSGITMKSFDGPQTNEIFIDEEDAIGDATDVSLTVGGQTVRRFAASAMVRVRDRELILGCSFSLTANDDVKSAEQTCAAWVRSVLDANSSKH
jgi:hypothetical protein